MKEPKQIMLLGNERDYLIYILEREVLPTIKEQSEDIKDNKQAHVNKGKLDAYFKLEYENERAEVLARTILYKLK